MKGLNRPKCKRGTWQESDLQEAVDLITCKKLSLRNYCIPRSTLQRYVHKGENVKKKLGRGPYLSWDSRKNPMPILPGVTFIMGHSSIF